MKTTASRMAVLCAIAIYIIAVSLLCWHKYTNLLYSDFDLAIHTQSLRNILHGSTDSSILGIPFPGNHMVLILYLIAPFYLVFPSPVLLLVIQTVILSAGAWGIFLLARRELNDRFAAAFAIAYLIYPPLLNLNLYEFHPVALTTCFLIYAFYFYRTERHISFWLSAILAMLCQENIPLIIAGFGFYALVQRRNWKWILPQIATGLILFTVITAVIMPRLNDRIQYLLMYAQFGKTPLEIVTHMVAHPFATLQFMFSAAKLDFLNLLAAPLGYLSLLNPLALLPGFPVLMQRLLSARPTEASIIYHYQAELIPFIFCSAILAAKSILSRFNADLASKLIWALLTVFPLAAFIMSAANPQFKYNAGLISRNSAARTITVEKLARIPETASVAATFEFLPKLSGRKNLYSLHHIYYGRYTLSTVPYQVPANIDYIVLNTFDPLTFSTSGFYGASNHTNIQNVLKAANWRVAQNLEGYLILMASHLSASPPVHPAPCPSSASTNITQNSAPGITLLGFELDPAVTNNIRELRCYWKKTSADTPDFDTVITLSVKGIPIWHGVLAPGSRIWPPQSWPTNTVICDTHNIISSEPTATSGELSIELIAPMTGR